MAVKALDHVNIVTRDLAASTAFYARIFDLEAVSPPAPLDPETIQWMNDASGHAIVHLMSHKRRETADAHLGGPTGSIDHVAFECGDLEGTKARLEADGLPYRENEVASIGLTQLFVRDPDNVLLELNFRGT